MRMWIVLCLLLLSRLWDVHITPTDEYHIADPLSPYGAQKLIGEVYCKQFYRTYGLRSTCLRYFNVYGERQLLEGAYSLVMGKFVQQRLNGEPMTIRGDGEQRRDFTYVGDVVKGKHSRGSIRKSTGKRGNSHQYWQWG